MNGWINNYVKAQKAAFDSVPADAVARLIELLRDALKGDHQIFCFGNGGSAMNSSHFATDLGKGSSDKLGKRFRVLSLNDNVSWMTALAPGSTCTASSRRRAASASCRFCVKSGGTLVAKCFWARSMDRARRKQLSQPK
jgi:hypothetical protein